MTSTLVFLEQYNKDGDDLLSHIVGVTYDVTLILFVNVETKEQSKQWMHTHSPKKPKMFKQTLSARKLTATIFWDRKGVLMKFMQRCTTATSEAYCETLKRKELSRAGHLQQKAWKADVRCSAPL
jgi:hypothetical protein